MGFFSPHKRHANQFNYTPRYYDPAKEERELRRAELRGERRPDEKRRHESCAMIVIKRLRSSRKDLRLRLH